MEAEFLREMNGHPVVPKLLQEFKISMYPYLNFRELTTKGVALFLFRHGVPVLYQERIKGRRLKNGEKISDSKTQQILIDFVQDCNQRDYTYLDWRNYGNVIIDDKGRPYVVDFGTVKRFTPDGKFDSNWHLKTDLEYLESVLFKDNRPDENLSLLPRYIKSKSQCNNL